MKLDNLLLIINSKHFLKLAIIILIAGTVATAGTLMYFAGQINTTVNVGTGTTNPDVYSITFDGNTPPFVIDETLSLLPDETIYIEYLVKNNENFAVTFEYNILMHDNDLEITITDGTDNTLSNFEQTIDGNTAKYVKFWYHVKPTAQEGTQLNAQIEVSVTS
jgi:hypothetical protein